MITELVAIEYYFGRVEAVMTLEDLVRKYGQDQVSQALADDDLELRATVCRIYALLTDRGRERAASLLAALTP